MSWEKFESGCKILADKIRSAKKQYRGIYGIPRGGLCVAVRLSHLLKLPLKDSKGDSILIVDDNADTGKALARFKGYDTATLYLKPWSKIKPTYHSFETEKWIVFPWERKG